MPVMQITKVPAEVLRLKAKPVKKVDPDIQQLIDDMVDTLHDAPGVGLAAPQVGISSRIIVVEWGDDEDEEAPKKLYAVVNPEITRSSDETEIGIEGCLSIPNIIGEVERHAAIQVKGLNRQGQPIKIKAEGWLARIFQHEIDHLNGILFTDRATSLSMVEHENTEEIEAQQIRVEKSTQIE
ncbi:MAG: peptide deformylase [Anaerolineae bacterium]|nr:peptide deformylase [Anaerolineae bacterium]